jgi:hypothetical protein
MSKTLGGMPNNKALIALSSVTKSFVDDLVAAGGLLQSVDHVRVWSWACVHTSRLTSLYAQLVCMVCVSDVCDQRLCVDGQLFVYLPAPLMFLSSCLPASPSSS